MILKKYLIALIVCMISSTSDAASWKTTDTEDTSVNGGEIVFVENEGATDNNWMSLNTIRTWLGSTFAAALGADDNYVTDAEKAVIGNTSGTNSGDQDLSTLKTKQPSTLNLTTDTSVSEAQLLANDYITNQGAAGEVDIILPVVSYTISRTIIVNEAQIIEVGPPTGEILDLSGTLLDANDVVDSPATVGSKMVVTRMQNAAGAWHYSLDTVRGTWVDSGASD